MRPVMPKRMLVVVAIVALLASTAKASVRLIRAGTTTVADIDVGEGDAALIQDPSGFDVLIDGGPAAAGSTVVDYIRNHSDKSIEVVLISHPDADHIGGLLSVLQASDIAIGQILYNGYPGNTQTWDNLVTLANSRSIPLAAVQFPAELHWGQLEAYILNPAGGLVNPDTNDASIVARIDYGSTQFLFTGDISAAIEGTVVARETPVKADMLKVAHHGSAYSSSSDFLAAVEPTGAVISVGTGNPYGLPAPSTLGRLASVGISVWRTDQSGTLVITSDGITVTFPSPFATIKMFLPLVMSLTNATPAPPGGANKACHSSGPAQICAWLSNGAPAHNSSVTVYAQLLMDNAGQTGEALSATWHYKTTSATCAGVTDSTGTASCGRLIGSATSGFTVDVDVSIAGYTATTWFTPQ